ncbi:sugar O-acetyltransferase [Gloeocapsopsis sp. IPPAS B-1203]|uniref:sugar O-acetyltransferase n=1 Tax=Gloeocapsopsis sp. IPPAS B-1203 TaxID=2049454 RepID=UPI000C17939C|nr:sugar O-acetyltransferase [Gloeocapsopsis sp. IPPAS B-1203]PIG91001.1 maltose acetyltransferase [Gloeocapsopsis sp. IPPAS B-1203]
MNKTAREKMLANEPYIAIDPELESMHKKAQNLLHTFNLSLPEESELRRAIVQKLFGSVGQVFEVKPPFRCDYGCHIYAKENLYINYDCMILDCNKVYLGNNVLLAPKVQIYTAYHPLDAEMRRSGLEMAAPIAIGDDVWIGGGAIICPGITIGNNTTIGAGSVVTKDIPANVVAAGNPCRIMRLSS